MFKKKTEVPIPKKKAEENFEDSPEKKFAGMASNVNFSETGCFSPPVPPPPPTG